MRTKYFNDGVVGNKKIKASFTKSGEMIRMFYGAADYKQFVEFYHTGIKVNDSALIYLHNDINNSFSQEYIKDTNVLQTHIYNSYFRVRITQSEKDSKCKISWKRRLSTTYVNDVNKEEIDVFHEKI